MDAPLHLDDHQQQVPDGSAIDSGRRLRPHTADVIVEAWGPSRASCIEQAVLGLVESFADLSRAAVTGEHVLEPAAPNDGELLVAALEEVIYLVDAEARVVCTVQAVDEPGSPPRIVYGMTRLDSVETIGPAPKGVTRHALGFASVGGAWRCNVVIDV
ncbi:MAG: archease [Candidatus Dormibacteraeota bacterium]|nr:archease [Candidatus Dormibacteraeota bacterium]